MSLWWMTLMVDPESRSAKREAPFIRIDTLGSAWILEDDGVGVVGL